MVKIFKPKEEEVKKEGVNEDIRIVGLQWTGDNFEECKRFASSPYRGPGTDRRITLGNNRDKGIEYYGLGDIMREPLPKPDSTTIYIRSVCAFGRRYEIRVGDWMVAIPACKRLFPLTLRNINYGFERYDFFEELSDEELFEFWEEVK